MSEWTCCEWGGTTESNSKITAVQRVCDSLSSHSGPYALSFATYYEHPVVAAAFNAKLARGEFSYCPCLAAACIANSMCKEAALLCKTSADLEALVNLACAWEERSPTLSPVSKVLAWVDPALCAIPQNLSPVALRVLGLSAFSADASGAVLNRLEARIGFAIPPTLSSRIVVCLEDSSLLTRIPAEKRLHRKRIRGGRKDWDRIDAFLLEPSFCAKRQQGHRDDGAGGCDNDNADADADDDEEMVSFFRSPWSRKRHHQSLRTRGFGPQDCACSFCEAMFKSSAWRDYAAMYAWGLDPPLGCVRGAASAWVDAIDAAHEGSEVLHGVKPGELVSWVPSMKKQYRLHVVCNASSPQDALRSAFFEGRNDRAHVLVAPSAVPGSGAVAGGSVAGGSGAGAGGSGGRQVLLSANAIFHCAAKAPLQKPAATAAAAAATALVSTLQSAQAFVLDAWAACLPPARHTTPQTAAAAAAAAAAATQAAGVPMALAALWGLRGWVRGPHAGAGPALCSLSYGCEASSDHACARAFPLERQYFATNRC